MNKQNLKLPTQLNCLNSLTFWETLPFRCHRYARGCSWYHAKGVWWPGAAVHPIVGFMRFHGTVTLCGLCFHAAYAYGCPGPPLRYHHVVRDAVCVGVAAGRCSCGRYLVVVTGTRWLRKG